MQKLQKSLVAFIAFLCLVSPAVISAQTPSTPAPTVKNAAKMEKVTDAALIEIDKRIDSLNKLITQVNAAKKLKTEQKQTLVTGIQAEITKLTSLKTKIEADTDPATLRTDKQSIIADNRVYALFIPQTRIVMHGDEIEAIADEMNDYYTKLKIRVEKAKADGNDTATLETKLTNIQTKLTDATAQAQKAIDTVISLTPTGFPGNKADLVTARGYLRTARTDLKDTWREAKAIRAALKVLRVPTAVVTARPQ